MYTFIPPVVTYAWGPSGSVVSPNSQNTATTALTNTTIYTVTASSNGCSSTASVTVTVDPLAGLAATNSTPNCAGSNFTVTANITGGGAPFTYTWDDGIGGTYAATATITVNKPVGSYNFTCTINDACGATVTSPVTVTVNPAATAAISPSTALICDAGTAVLTASGGTSYAWAANATLSVTVVPQPQHKSLLLATCLRA
jgi:hypothetical protein